MLPPPPLFDEEMLTRYSSRSPYVMLIVGEVMIPSLQTINMRVIPLKAVGEAVNDPVSVCAPGMVVKGLYTVSPESE